MNPRRKEILEINRTKTGAGLKQSQNKSAIGEVEDKILFVDGPLRKSILGLCIYIIYENISSIPQVLQFRILKSGQTRHLRSDLRSLRLPSCYYCKSLTSVCFRCERQAARSLKSPIRAPLRAHTCPVNNSALTA